jgi:hypothetical protein
VALAAIVGGATVLALLWVFLVPINQSPDEPVHFDYAISLNETRSLFRPEYVPPELTRNYLVHPYTIHLATAAQTGEVALHPDARMAAGYGTRRFYQELEQLAPPRDGIRLPRPPALSGLYPFGYYAVLAVWLEGVRHVHDGPVGLFFGARLFSVLLFGLTLVFSYATCRELDLRPALALALTAMIGFFPMTTFVSSYVQPDNLAFSLVSLGFFLALRWRRRPGGGLSAALGLTLGLLWVTKPHFAACVLLSAVSLVAARLWAERASPLGWLRHGALLLSPAVLLGSVQVWVTWGLKNEFNDPPPFKDFNTGVMHRFTEALMNYCNGPSHRSFWGVFGWVDAPLVIGTPRTTERVHFLIHAGTWVVLALILLRLQQVSAKLWQLWRRGRGATAVRLALAHVPINSFFIFTVVMFVLYIRLANRFGAQGRNWLPFLLPLFLSAIVYAPKVLTGRGARRAFAGALIAGLLLFDGFGSYYAIQTIKNRYYVPGNEPHLLSAETARDHAWEAPGGW